jgi:hypothetical protein
MWHPLNFQEDLAMFHGTKTGRVMSLAAAVAVLVSAPALAGQPDRAKLDTNRDGKVDFAEARAALPDFTQDQFNKADANRDGQLSDDEWSTLPGKGHHYGELDANKDGNYSLDEVRATHPNLTQREYADFDVNKDGKVSKDELKLTTDKPGAQ